MHIFSMLGFGVHALDIELDASTFVQLPLEPSSVSMSFSVKPTIAALSQFCKTVGAKATMSVSSGEALWLLDYVDQHGDTLCRTEIHAVDKSNLLGDDQKDNSDDNDTVYKGLDRFEIDFRNNVSIPAKRLAQCLSVKAKTSFRVDVAEANTSDRQLLRFITKGTLVSSTKCHPLSGTTSNVIGYTEYEEDFTHTSVSLMKLVSNFIKVMMSLDKSKKKQTKAIKGAGKSRKRKMQVEEEEEAPSSKRRRQHDGDVEEINADDDDDEDEEEEEEEEDEEQATIQTEEPESAVFDVKL